MMLSALPSTVFDLLSITAVARNAVHGEMVNSTKGLHRQQQQGEQAMQ